MSVVVEEWENCYESGWKGMITPAAFAHPAKYSRSLIERIFAHCLARGYLKKGDVVGDCFGGIGTGGIAAAYAGLKWRGCELEPRFVKMAADNFKLHHAAWLTLKLPWPYMIRGDSRQFDALLWEDCNAMVSSPPYADSIGKFDGDKKSDEVIGKWFESYRSQGGGLSFEGFKKHVQNGRRCGMDDYGKEPGQIGALKSGAVDSVIASPPFAGTSGQGGGGINVNGYVPKDPKNRNSNPDLVSERTYQGRGADRTAGSIEILKEGSVDGVISSPPYADSIDRASGIDPEKVKKPGGPNGQTFHQPYDAVISSPPYSDIAAGAGGLNTKPAQHAGQQSGRTPEAASQSGNWSKDLLRYGKSDGQISRLKSGSVEAVVTSPPWEANNAGGVGANKLKDPDKFAAEMSRLQRGHSSSPEARKKQFAKASEQVYGETKGQIGNDSGETYWQSVDAVYRACFRTIKPGGVIVLVVKDYVKAKKRVPLCDDTARLLEHIGFSVIERIHAMLVKETTHDDLFPGQSTVEKKERKSFFRRLAEKKGSPKIDFEEVIIARRP